MRIFSKSTLREYWAQNPRAENALRRWHSYVENADWRTPADVREYASTADFVGSKVIFNIGGNNYRLIVDIDYEFGAVYIKFVGTHKEYDRIDISSL
ncbi:MAG: type II toxin-antitoxin system HigB family toxin [Caldilineaceae bacterium]